MFGALTMDLVASGSNRTITRTVGNIGNGNGFLSVGARGTPRGGIAHCCGAAGSDACGIVKI